jgi:hypothetical protein
VRIFRKELRYFHRSTSRVAALLHRVQGRSVFPLNALRWALVAFTDHQQPFYTSRQHHLARNTPVRVSKNRQQHGTIDGGSARIARWLSHQRSSMPSGNSGPRFAVLSFKLCFDFHLSVAAWRQSAEQKRRRRPRLVIVPENSASQVEHLI